MNRGNLVLSTSFTGNFRVQLDQRAGKPVNVVQVVVGPTGFVGAPRTNRSSTTSAPRTPAVHRQTSS
jgi:hypothetical protein